MAIGFLKIDTDFVRDLDSNPSNRYLVKAIVGRPPDEMFVHDQSHSLGKIVVEYKGVVAGAESSPGISKHH